MIIRAISLLHFVMLFVIGMSPLAHAGSVVGELRNSIIADVEMKKPRVVMPDGTKFESLSLIKTNDGLDVSVLIPGKSKIIFTISIGDKGQYKVTTGKVVGIAPETRFFIDIPATRDKDGADEANNCGIVEQEPLLPEGAVNAIWDIYAEQFTDPKYYTGWETDCRMPIGLRLAFWGGEPVPSYSLIFCGKDYASNFDLKELSGAAGPQFKETGELTIFTSNAQVSAHNRRGAVTTLDHGDTYFFSDGFVTLNQRVEGTYLDPFFATMKPALDAEATKFAVTQVASHKRTATNFITGEYAGIGTNGRDFIAAYRAGEIDVQRGLGGNDSIFGWSGNDYIIAGPGNDVLIGEYGMDTYVGGPDADIFVVEIGDRNGGYQGVFNDVLMDFNPAEGDMIHLVLSKEKMAEMSENIRLTELHSDVMVEVKSDSGDYMPVILIKGGKEIGLDIILDHLM